MESQSLLLGGMKMGIESTNESGTLTREEWLRVQKEEDEKPERKRAIKKRKTIGAI